MEIETIKPKNVKRETVSKAISKRGTIVFSATLHNGDIVVASYPPLEARILERGDTPEHSINPNAFYILQAIYNKAPEAKEEKE